MSAWRQTWLVAGREIRERARSKAFRASLIVMALLVVAVIVLPSVLSGTGGTKDVGLAGTNPDQLAGAIAAQAEAVGITVATRSFSTVAEGESAVRDGDIDVLVVDGNRLVTRRRPDEQLRSVVAAAVQSSAITERATAAGIAPAELATMLQPVPIEIVELGRAAGRSTDDEMVVLVINVVLLMAIATFGNLVLTGVVEEKASRVVEVLLARISARTLLAGKVLGIGLLGIGQVAVTAVAAGVATTTVDAFDVPAARASVFVWAVVWFVLGYALFAVVYGALGSLTSRTEDAQSVAGPVTVILLVGYWASFIAVGRPDSLAARLVSFLPPTAPFAMPSRVAMGGVSWWEPLLSVALTLVTIAGLVELGGRVYARAVLQTGRTLKLREAWRAAAAPQHDRRSLRRV